jgi:hypothetical protein
MRRRPLSPHPVPFPRPPGAPLVTHQSYADIARRGERAFLYCDNCSPPLTIEADFQALIAPPKPRCASPCPPTFHYQHRLPLPASFSPDQ